MYSKRPLSNCDKIIGPEKPKYDKCSSSSTTSSTTLTTVPPKITTTTATTTIAPIKGK